MILSVGNNQFKNNTFDFWTWSAPVLQTADEVIAAIREQKLIGRVIKDIQAVGYGYYNTCGWFNEIAEAICKNDDQALESMDFPCVIEVDEPLLILFEDGDILGIEFSEGSSMRMELNTLPWGISPHIGCKNFHADQLFRDILGNRIDDIDITSSIMGPIFTYSYGMTLAEQPSYLRSFSFICYDGGSDGKPMSWRDFKFEADADYGCVSIERKSDPIRLPASRLRDVLKGYMTVEDMKEWLES